jgi:hypothetical protein
LKEVDIKTESIKLLASKAKKSFKNKIFLYNKLIAMRKLLFLNFLLISALAQAQVIDVSTAAKAITADGLKAHLSIIASAEMQGRETGTEGERKAAAY